MTNFKVEGMDSTGRVVVTDIDAPTEDEAQKLFRQMGYFLTKIESKEKAPEIKYEELEVPERYVTVSMFRRWMITLILIMIFTIIMIIAAG
jgi:type II secretory pathway component PulF